MSISQFVSKIKSRLKKNSTSLLNIIFILSISLIFHKIFSSCGLNPSDDGVVLSNAKRLLFNQIPHKDFIQIRPIGSNLFWIPIIWGFKQFNIPGLIIACRFIFWLQIFTISWIWISIVNKLTIQTKPFNLYPLVIISAIISSHNFPPMPWTTIDGIFFASIGIYLFFSSNKIFNKIGLLFLGFTPWCRQSFAIIPMAFWLLLNKKDKVKSFLPLILPSLILSIYLFSQEALIDMINQLTSRSEIYKVGIKTYIEKLKNIWQNKDFLILIWPISIIIIFTKNKKINSNFITLFILSLICLLTINKQISNPKDIAFFIFYLCIFMFPWLIIKKNKKTFYLILLISTSAWTTSISLGYNTPVLFIGNCFICIYLILAKYLNPKNYKYIPILNIIILLLILPKYINYRNTHIYRDLSKTNLNSNLGEIYPALNNIYSNKNMFDYFSELKNIYNKYKKLNQQKIALAPSNAIFWSLENDQNPISLDWIQNAEYPNISLKNRVEKDFNPKKIDVLIVTKYEVKQIANKRKQPINLSLYNVLQNIENKYKKIDETEFFNIYSNNF